MAPMTSGPDREPLLPNGLLVEKLASVLPKGYKFGIYHLSTPPTKTTALCSAPPDARPDKTYCENHFLAVSIDAGSSSQSPGPNGSSRPPGERASVKVSPTQTLILALEVFVYSTAHSTTIFVSKADSTGYLELLRLPKGTPSPIREVAAAFLSFLLERRRRKGIQTIVSLFARSQPQYLFPRSVENSGKHVLDDRGLVRWWCRVLNPLIEDKEEDSWLRGGRGGQWGEVKGYLIIPGLDDYETRAFLPRSPAASANWKVGHPLDKISHYTAEYDWVPPRCLIARFPDDPKSRFRDELDEEAASWMKDTGSWKSVRTLDQFWDMMAFRQECSSGRLTGFIWVVFDPKQPVDSTSPPPKAATSPVPAPRSTLPPSTPAVDPAGQPLPSTPCRRNKLGADGDTPPQPTPSKPGSAEKGENEKKQEKKKKKLTGRIIPRQPHIKTHQRNYLVDRPVSTAYYHWPPAGRGEKIVDENDYKRVVEHLLHLDFSTLPKACASTRRWIRQAGIGAATWGQEVVGTRNLPIDNTVGHGSSVSASSVNNLSNLVKRKRADAETVPTSLDGALANPVNVLNAGLVRKKRKDEDNESSLTSDSKQAELASCPQPAGDISDTPKVNVLGAGLIRKKPKPS